MLTVCLVKSLHPNLQLDFYRSLSESGLLGVFGRALVDEVGGRVVMYV